MKRLSSVLMLVVLGVLVSGGSLIAKPDKPFKGNAEGTSTAAEDVSPYVFSTTSKGILIGSHLGRGTYEGASEQDWFVVGGQFGVVSGGIIFTAANGDMLLAEADEECSFVFEVGSGGTTYMSTITYDIVGGTGRFENATGRFTSESLHIRVGVGPSDDVSSWSGTINLN